jgi:4-hydroxy-3-methylbut-2-enyl diphosphate reductase
MIDSRPVAGPRDPAQRFGSSLRPPCALDLRPVLLAPLRIEAAVARLGARGRRVERIGMGPARAEVARARLARSLAPGTPLGVVGLAGGLSASDRAGDVVVATALLTAAGSRAPVALDAELAERVRRALMADPALHRRVRSGPVACTQRLMPPATTAQLPAVAGALVCEMESAWLAPLADRGPFAVVRVVVDHPGRHLAGPWTVTGGVTALRRLAVVAGILADELDSYATSEPIT